MTIERVISGPVFFFFFNLGRDKKLKVSLSKEIVDYFVVEESILISEVISTLKQYFFFFFFKVFVGP